MGNPSRFDGSLSIITRAPAAREVAPAEFLAQAEALGLKVSSKEPDDVEAVVSEAKALGGDVLRFFHYFKYDEASTSFVRDNGADPATFYDFADAVGDVARLFYLKGYRLQGEVYRLGEDREDIQRVKVDGDEIKVEYPDVIFRFSDGAIYKPLPL